jgi:hypothetical protein
MAQRRRQREAKIRAEAAVLMGRYADLFRDWGREGGKVGGKLRWKGVSAEQRRAHAKKAAAARWTKRKRGQ